MRKLMLLVALIVVACGTGMAQSSNAAVVINHGTAACGMPGSDPTGNMIFGGIGVVFQEVQNNNKVTIKCKGTGIINLSGMGQEYSGFGCGVIAVNGNFYIATDTHATVSESGIGTLSCTYSF